MIDTVIFDLDGTLLNTLDDLADSVNYALSQFDFPMRQVSEIRDFVGNGVEKLIERAVEHRLSELEEKDCLNIFKQHYSQNMNNKTRPYDGILDLIKQLIADNYHIAIVSNKFDSAVKGLNETYFEGLFPVAIGESASIAKKPAPDSVYEALAQLNVTGESAIYVGDSDVDVMTAHNAGLQCVGVTWGFRDRELLLSMGAEYIIDTPTELFAVLDGRKSDC
ncbi:MAG: HAD-IA family hydrolase [Lachnospiraceae bacterium]|nr:HAD-IA family hydrolase [Lachnospiraceae bacterium]